MNIFIIVLASIGGLVLLTGLIVLCATITPSIVVLFKLIPFTIEKNIEAHKTRIEIKLNSKEEKKAKKLLTENKNVVSDPANEIIE